jgi:hypothetical protein
MSGPDGQFRFGVVGSGWRALLFMRVAQALPERFLVSGIGPRARDRRYGPGFMPDVALGLLEIRLAPVVERSTTYGVLQPAGRERRLRVGPGARRTGAR